MTILYMHIESQLDLIQTAMNHKNAQTNIVSMASRPRPVTLWEAKLIYRLVFSFLALPP